MLSKHVGKKHYEQPSNWTARSLDPDTQPEQLDRQAYWDFDKECKEAAVVDAALTEYKGVAWSRYLRHSSDQQPDLASEFQSEAAAASCPIATAVSCFTNLTQPK